MSNVLSAGARPAGLSYVPATGASHVQPPPASDEKDVKVDSKTALPVRSALPTSVPGPSPSPSPPSSLTDDWVDLYSNELLSAADGAETKHNIIGISFATCYPNPTFSFATGQWAVLNGPAQGTSMQSRLGNEIRCKSAHIRLEGFIDSTQPYIVGPTAVPLPFGAPYHVRCRIFWDSAPTQISAIYPVAFSNNTIPGSVNALHGEFLLGDAASNVAAKHWITNKRYEIIYDKVFKWKDYSCCTYGQSTGNKETVMSGHFFEEIHLDLKGRVVQFSDTTANTFINNALIMVFTSDVPASSNYFLPTVRYISDFQFFDPQ